MRETLDTYCIRTGNQTLLDQWDSQQNDPYTPQTVTYGSKKKCGGAAKRDMRGKRAFTLVLAVEQAVPTVRGSCLCREKRIWLRVFRIWQPSGTL